MAPGLNASRPVLSTRCIRTCCGRVGDATSASAVGTLIYIRLAPGLAQSAVLAYQQQHGRTWACAGQYFRRTLMASCDETQQERAIRHSAESLKRQQWQSLNQLAECLEWRLHVTSIRRTCSTSQSPGMGYWTEQVHYKAGAAYLGQGFRIQRRAPDAGQSAQRQPGQHDADGCRSTGGHILSTPILKNVNLQRAILRIPFPPTPIWKAAPAA